MESFGVMFHHFYDEKHVKCQGAYNKSDLIKLIDVLNNKYLLLGADEYHKHLNKGTLTSNMVCLTFDDGLKCQYDIAYPILKEKGLSAFYFVYSQPIVSEQMDRLEIYHDFRFSKFDNVDDFYIAFFEHLKTTDIYLKYDIKNIIAQFKDSDYRPECTFYTHYDRLYRYIRGVLGEEYHQIMSQMMIKYVYDIKNTKDLWMNPDNLKEMSDDGNIIGLHSYSHHTAIHLLGKEEQVNEWKTNKDDLEKIIGGEIKAASYPCGNFNENTVSIMKELGITEAFADSMDNNRNKYGRYSLPRRDSGFFLREMK